MNDKDLFVSQTQARLTYTLVYALVGLIFALLIAAFCPLPVNDKIIAMVNPLVTGLLPLAGGAIGFWIARHRAPSDDDTTPVYPAPSSVTVVTPETKTTTTTESTQSS